MDIKVVDQEKRHRLKEDIMKKLDKLENEFLADVKVDGAGNNNTIDFDTVKFNEPVSRSIVITNIGQVSQKNLENALIITPPPKKIRPEGATALRSNASPFRAGEGNCQKKYTMEVKTVKARKSDKVV